MTKKRISSMAGRGHQAFRVALSGFVVASSILLVLYHRQAAARTAEIHLADWRPAGMMAVSPNRTGVQVTSIGDNRVIVTGGARLGTVGATSELYDGFSWKWSRLPDMACPRAWHTATKLPDGSVLVVGGNVQPESPSSLMTMLRNSPSHSNVHCEAVSEAEVYHPVTNSWEGVGSTVRTPRWGHIAVSLQNGEVLIAGGHNQSDAINSAEIYNSSTRQWRQVSPMQQVRHLASAVRLLDGRVLIVGGTIDSGLDWGQMAGSATAEVYDPSADTWTTGGSMVEARWLGTATLLNDGRVIATGMTSPLADASKREGSSEVFDAQSNTWSNYRSMVGKVDIGMSATLLPSGRLLLAGGFWIAEGTPSLAAPAQIYDPETNSWETTVQPANRHAFPGADRLNDGSVLLVGEGGQPERFWEESPTPSSTSVPSMTITVVPSPTALPSLTSTDSPPLPSATSTRTATITPTPSLTSLPIATRHVVGSWMQVASPHFRRHGGDAVLLSDGRVLFVGGYYRISNPIAQTLHPPSEIYDPKKDEWSLAGELNEPRVDFRLVSTESGDVFVIGGVWDCVPRTSVERFDTKTSTWILHGDIGLPANRWLSHLVSPALNIAPRGVLISGTWPASDGNCGNALSSETFLFDLQSRVLALGPRFVQARSEYLAAHLTDGSVLVAGGTSEYEELVRFCEKRFVPLVSSEILRPGEAAFQSSGDLSSPHSYPDSNLVALSRARAVVVGGIAPSSAMSIELFESVTDSWTSILGMKSPHNSAQVSELTGQKLLISGGFDNYIPQGSAELLDLRTFQWFDAGEMFSRRGRAASVVLQDGRVLVVGGDEQGTAEIYTLAEDSPPKHLFVPSLLSKR